MDAKQTIEAGSVAVPAAAAEAGAAQAASAQAQAQAQAVPLAIEVNGEPRSVPPQHTLQALVEELGLAHQALALAVNRSVVPRQAWPARMLQERDKVDIVRAIGGG